ncbi:MAG TPA: pseudouridine synthase [Terriglobia bacterium]|nr:pseudouridine synthase [Terriglobia bacterium]
MTDERDGHSQNKVAAAETPEGERIAKVMARAGLCSRRDAEAWIAAGRVTLNGKKLVSPAVNVGPMDVVRVDGKPLPEAEKTRLFRYHKPRGLVTTAKDPEGRPTVFDNLPEGLPRVISVGRLDLNSEGLLLLTNDGELARRLELPATGWVRRYRVRVNGHIDPTSLTRLARGIEIEGVRYGAIEAVLDRQQGDNAWLTMSLTEGKNREIRKVCAFFGWTVSRLIRLSYGPFQLGHLEKGQMEEVPGKVLRDQLGQPGAVQPLRPHQAGGGKARPPKPRQGESRSAAPTDERDSRVYQNRDRQGRDQRSRTASRTADGPHIAEHRQAASDQRRGNSDRRQDRDRPQQQRDERPSQLRVQADRKPGRQITRQENDLGVDPRKQQSAEALAASLRNALDRAGREERAEELAQRHARPQAGKPVEQKFPGKSRDETKAGNFKRSDRGSGTAKPGKGNSDSGKTRPAKSAAADTRPARSSGKPDTASGNHPSGRSASRAGGPKAKHAHRQRRP